MKRFILAYILLTLLLIILTTGCAPMMAISAVSTITTGKSLTDHTSTQLTQHDCNTIRTITEQTYYCEQTREPGTTYNRNTY